VFTLVSPGHPAEARISAASPGRAQTEYDALGCDLPKGELTSPVAGAASHAATTQDAWETIEEMPGDSAGRTGVPAPGLAAA
jgi:hypothetical protein